MINTHIETEVLTGMRWEGRHDNKDGLPGTPKSLAKKRTLSPPKFAKKSAVTRTYGL
jgi:hypothetical protein